MHISVGQYGLYRAAVTELVYLVGLQKFNIQLFLLPIKRSRKNMPVIFIFVCPSICT